MTAAIAQSIPDAVPATVGLSQRVLRRLEIVALNRSGFSPPAIVWLTGCDGMTVSRWINRFDEQGRLLERPRTGRPAEIDETVRLKAVAFYCQVSPLPGCRRWSFSWAEKHLEEHPEILGRSISGSSLHRIVHSHALKPHLHKYFMQITDPDFFPKVDHLIDLYQPMPHYLFFFDECPNLQALKRKDPPMQAREDYPNYESHDYTRHGTVDLLAFLQPNTGEVFGRCTSDHKTTTLVSVFKEHVAAQPDDVQLHYVMDNLSPHYHNDFCEAVAALCGVRYEPLKTGAERREWLQSPDKRIAIHFTPFHGSWLNMVEIWFGIFQPKCIDHADFHSTDQLREAIDDFIGAWNRCFKHPFTWQYDGVGLHEKAIRRFVRLLYIESREMDARFIGNQCLLMSNLIRDYHALAPDDDWENLRHVWRDKEAFAARVIQNDPGPRRRKHALEALSQFNSALSNLNRERQAAPSALPG